jgi:IS605 OrfB family transposase
MAAARRRSARNGWSSNARRTAMRTAKVQRTDQTRIADPEGTAGAVLDAYADLYGRAERALFAAMRRGVAPGALKSEFMARFGLTARQFNALAINLKGKIASIKERRDGLIDEAKARIKKARQVVAKLDKALAKPIEAAARKRLLNKRHQKQRRLATQHARFVQLEADRDAGTVRICFGRRKLFRAQFDLEANGYTSLDEWRADWQRARSSQFFVIGSKDETGGCQGCVGEYLGGQRFALRLRLPPALCASGEKYQRLEIDLPYGTDQLVAALTLEQAVSYRFRRDAKGWRVFVTTQALPFTLASDRRLGVIGVDLNADHLAVCETDHFGNPIAALTIPLVTYGLDRDQTQAAIGNAIKSLMEFARDKGKPLAIEKLAFAQKKAALEDEGPRHARMLSALAYARIGATLRARAHDAGLEVIARNPAYTSVIGREKFAGRYGLSPHHAAALVIARRALNLSERPNRRARTARPLPARNRGRHVWSFWRQVAQQQRRMYRAGSRSQDRSRSPPALRGAARAETLLSAAGATPARESSAALFG